MQRRSPKLNRNAFTLVELLIAMFITGLITSAVAGLAFAVSNAYDGADSQVKTQSEFRTAILQFQEAVKKSQLVVRSSSYQVCLWLDDIDGDKNINVEELVYFDTNFARTKLVMTTFEADGMVASYDIALDLLDDSGRKEMMIDFCDETETDIVENVENVYFSYDNSAPRSNRVTLEFDIVRDGVSKHFEVSATKIVDSNIYLRYGNLISSDDDI